jgi:hypothetical protein
VLSISHCFCKEWLVSNWMKWWERIVQLDGVFCILLLLRMGNVGLVGLDWEGTPYDFALGLEWDGMGWDFGVVDCEILRSAVVPPYDGYEYTNQR